MTHGVGHTALLNIQLQSIEMVELYIRKHVCCPQAGIEYKTAITTSAHSIGFPSV